MKFIVNTTNSFSNKICIHILCEAFSKYYFNKLCFSEFFSNGFFVEQKPCSYE